MAVTVENFQVEVEFKVCTAVILCGGSELLPQISGEQSHLFGDGLALWLTTERAQPGPVFGSKGALNDIGPPQVRLLIRSCMLDKFKGLGVFIDTSV